MLAILIDREQDMGMDIRHWIKVVRKAAELIGLGLINLLKIIFYRLPQPSCGVLIKTRIGNVLIRQKN